MEPLPGWAERLAEAASQPASAPERRLVLPKAATYYAGRTTLVATAGDAEALAQLAAQRPLSHIGFDTEFKYDAAGVIIDADHTWYDPHSVHPLLLSLALAEPDGDGGSLSSFVVDLRQPEVFPALEAVFRLPIRFVAHYAHAELLCLLRLGLPEPKILWDSWVCEKVLYLGRHHKNYHLGPNTDDGDEAHIRAEAEQADLIRYSLPATCQRYGLAHPFTGDKNRLQSSFLEHPDSAPFTAEQVCYAAADAVAAAQLYLPQVLAAARDGVLHHLETVELPWTATNARMVWNGVRVDQAKCHAVADACRSHEVTLIPQLAAMGITKPRSHHQLKPAFERLGLLDLFWRAGKLSFDKGQLDTFRERHPVIALVRAARRVIDLREDKILTGEFVSADDGRVHPSYRQLGTHTGRQSCRWPNILGLGKVFRPLIVPGPGRGLGEVDWSQIEVGLAAAIYHDAALVRMFNTGDAYAAMAQDFFRDRLSEVDRRLPGIEFKRKYPDLRDRMKACTLGIIYGVTPHGLARQLDTTVAAAAALQERFMAMFPTLERGLRKAAAFGAIRGYATTVSGLRRYRARGAGRLSNWERNWLTNHPVQGSAAVVFKVAGNRLDRLYRQYDAWLVVPLHDAFVFECPTRC